MIAKRAMLALIAIVIAALLFGQTARAQVSINDKLAGVEARQYDQYTLVAVDRPFGDIVKDLQKISGINIMADQFKDRPITIELTVPQDWRVTFSILLNMINADVRVIGSRTIKIVPIMMIDLEKTPFRKAVYMLANSSGKNVVIDHDVEDRIITVHLKGVDFEASLRAVASAGGYELVKENENLYRIASMSTLQKQLVTTRINLKFLRPDPPYRAVIDAQVAITPDSTTKYDPLDPDQSPDVRFPLLLALKEMLTRDPADPTKTIGHIEYISATNSLIITDMKPKIEQITEIVAKIDRNPYQVMIDVKFVTTSNTDFFDFGIDFRNGINAFASGSSSFLAFPFSAASNVMGSAFGKISKATRAGASGIGLGSDYGLFIDPDQDGGADRIPFTFGTLGFDQLQATLRLLKSDQATEIIQRPQILTLDHKEATIFVGARRHYARTVAATNSQGGLSFGIEESPNSPVDTGFQLLVIPHVIEGEVDKNGNKQPDRIMMTVIPESETLCGTTSPIAGFDRFTSTETGSGNQVTIDLPQVSSQSLVTNMMLKSNQTAIIGGLITERDSESIRKVPFLGDIPLLGYFFKNKQHNIIKSNLIIFITPRIVYNDVDIKEIFDREIKLNKRNYPRKYPEAKEDGKEHRKSDIEDAYNKIFDRKNPYKEWKKYDDPYGIGNKKQEEPKKAVKTDEVSKAKKEDKTKTEPKPKAALKPAEEKKATGVDVKKKKE